MLTKYLGWTIFQRELEYVCLKNEWYETHDYDEKAYDAFIGKIIRELGL